ncbi:NADH-quinone oxidoreductase subunit J family protein [Megalodesulfovibrio gigas]|uniref:NADH-quinone oxidoreductase subunit J n=1 Tax=Megalodesulfovibrio gigas (strain ATCC 19364 / DSM 1382 / NCIMB 9332 / VKM B-1759) TaxID=1121448 RepID=T2G7L0_MEGG1|nr:NADH-quinone oxidoreductase subunit J [Megalodesulfovibrio gigas]AGW12179.1 putative NADH-ubiquinone/plastoquinone oxidoreductase chain 6 [Megalodesulfovibrio gigas DSM 1382 = ATCC 19364]
MTLDFLTADATAKALFLLYFLAILVGGIMAVAAKNLVKAMLGLVKTLFGVSGMYLLMQAPFIALMQLLIYVGAVSVLIFFAIMLTRGEEEGCPAASKKILAVLAAASPAAILGGLLLRHAPMPSGTPVETSLAVLGNLLLTDYVLAFEAISLVLFVAMAGAVVLGFERRLSK